MLRDLSPEIWLLIGVILFAASNLLSLWNSQKHKKLKILALLAMIVLYGWYRGYAYLHLRQTLDVAAHFEGVFGMLPSDEQQKYLDKYIEQKKGMRRARARITALVNSPDEIANTTMDKEIANTTMEEDL